MKYILPLEKERQKYFFEMSDDGKELKKNNIEPYFDKDNIFEEKGIVYVTSPYNEDEYFKLDEFLQKSKIKFKEILIDLSIKLGAKVINASIVEINRETNSINNNDHKEFQAEGRKNLIGAELGLEKSQEETSKAKREIINSMVLNEQFKGNKLSEDEIDDWIKQNKIKLEDTPIFKRLYENFKNNNLVSNKYKYEMTEIISGSLEIIDSFGLLAGIETPFFSSKFSTKLKNDRKIDYSFYKSLQFQIEIIFE